MEFFTDSPRVCYITSIYGSYEATCKRFVKQTVSSDFICFTDNPNIENNGWEVDTTPYHLNNRSTIDDGTYINSLDNNKHSFNVAKYYKQSFQNIPRLKNYEAIIWLDGTIEIIYDRTSEYILNNIRKEKIIGWHHEHRGGILQKEIEASHTDRYTSTFWNNQSQPFQDIDKQYKYYLENGYNEAFFKDIKSHTEHLGVWITCFVAFDNKDKSVTDFLNMWYLQTLQHTTQDQVGFSYVCQKTGIIPLTLPNNEITGDNPHEKTQFYIKHTHGK
jgi:hypothetical protein